MTEWEVAPFQCSSASRKFLNNVNHSAPVAITSCFSALQRAENSSMSCSSSIRRCGEWVSVLFSEPKIPQCRGARPRTRRRAVSVLFSEPKIPQSKRGPARMTESAGFSALQRAENSSIPSRPLRALMTCRVSVLFSEPKIPQ